MADEKKEFIVPAGLYTAAFDLDYTQNEIKDTQKLYEKDDHFINRTTLRALVTEHPFFAKFFHWQRYDTPYKPPNPHALDEDETACRKRGNSIPAELFSFFKLYMMEVRSEKRKSMAVRKGKVPEGMEDSFYKRLLDYAHAEEENSASCDSEIYWTRCLYGNEHFQRTAVRNLWDEEYMLRTRCLYEKVKHLPPEQQLAMFQDVVHYLDDGITKASQMKENHGDIDQTQESGLEGFLDEFPKQVITHCRKRTASKHRDKRVTYTVEDLDLQLGAESFGSNDRRYQRIKSLETAMKWIRGNTDGSLKVKEAARKAYLRRLNQNTPKSKFQKDYEASCEYVNACTIEISPEKLREKIASRAAAYYGSAFRGAIAIPGYYIHDQKDTWKKSEMDRLIEEYVVRAYSLFYYQFKNYLEFINGSRTDRDDFAAQIADMAHFAWDNPNAPEDEQAYQYRLTGYLNYLGAVMPKALSHSFILGAPVNVEQQQVLVGLIAELCVQTCEKLGIGVEEWADADKLHTVIGRYNSVVFPQKEFKLPPGFDPYDVVLRKALITLKVGEAFDECCQTTEQNILTLTAAIKEMKQK